MAPMQAAATLKHHDHGYVERRGGLELLTHLRGAPARIAYRRQAIDRAFDRFARAEGEGKPEPEIGGLGLIVLQRAALAAEDLGGLLHALIGSDPWSRLRSANIADLDAAFDRGVREPQALMEEAFRLPSDSELREEGLSEEQIGALGRLRGRTAGRWYRMLVRAAEFWLNYRSAAKATMHGFPFVAGEHLLGPPRAGNLADGIRPSPFGRFALGIPAALRGTEVRTERTVVRLDRDAVTSYRSAGRGVARLYGELCELQATSIMGGYAVGIPFTLAGRLSQQDQALVAAAAERLNEGEND